MKRAKKEGNKWIWTRVNGRYRKVCRNPKVQDNDAGWIDGLKYNFYIGNEKSPVEVKYERIKKWPEVTREAYAGASKKQKEVIEELMIEDEGAKVFIGSMPEMLVVGNSVRVFRTKHSQITSEIDGVLRAVFGIKVEAFKD